MLLETVGAPRILIPIEAREGKPGEQPSPMKTVQLRPTKKVPKQLDELCSLGRCRCRPPVERGGARLLQGEQLWVCPGDRSRVGPVDELEWRESVDGGQPGEIAGDGFSFRRPQVEGAECINGQRGGIPASMAGSVDGGVVCAACINAAIIPCGQKMHAGESKRPLPSESWRYSRCSLRAAPARPQKSS